MDASLFDTRHYPTLSVQEGYTAWAASYDEATMKELMDYRLLSRIDAVAWEQLEAAACGLPICARPLCRPGATTW